MTGNNLVDGLNISDTTINGKCENCILDHQTCRPFDGTTEMELVPLELIALDLWGPSWVQPTSGDNE